MPAMPPGRVVFVEAYPHLYGGGQRTTHLLARSLRERGLGVAALTTGPGPFTHRLRADGIEVTVVGLPDALGVFGHAATGHAAARAGAALPRAWATTTRALAGLRPDVIHAVDLRGGLLAAPGAHLVGSPLVWHAHLTEPQPALNRLVDGLASAVVVPSPAVLDDFPGVRRARVRTVTNAVSPAVAGLGPAPHRPGAVVTAARLVPQKGLDVLIDATARLAGDHPDLTVEVSGDEQEGYRDHAADLRRRACDERVADRVRWLGPVDEPARGWVDRGAAIYVQPSRWEILPLAIMEAMAVGLPVVAADVGGVAELVDPGVTGLLVPPGDAAALAGALASLLDDPGRAAALGAAGRTRILATHGLEAVTDRWLELYRSLGRSSLGRSSLGRSGLGRSGPGRSRRRRPGAR